MIYILIAAVIGAFILIYTQFRKKKYQSVEKDALQLAWEKKDYEAYLGILNEKIEKTSNKKEKNFLATLKMQAYIAQKQWHQMDSLKKQVKTKNLPKKIHLTFVTQYMIGLCLSDRPEAALKWMEIEEPILKEAESNGTYKMYIGTLKALKLFYTGHLQESKEQFTELKAMKITGDFYPPLFNDYLKRIEKEQKKQMTEPSETKAEH
jgi:DNA-directed RNA polymerase beta subunit